MRRLLAAAVLATTSVVLAACGGSDVGKSSRPAPEASSFPRPQGKSLDQFLARAGKPGELVISPTGQVYREGKNRYGFGVFTVGREQVENAVVALYAAPAKGGKVEGPFPARVESLETEARYRAKTTSGDPDAAKAVYVAEIPLDRKGEWRVGGLIKRDGELTSTDQASAVVGQFDEVPKAGDKAPRVSTPTKATAKGGLSSIETRDPADTMHEEDLAKVLGKKPVVVVFATPKLCQSRVCGPVVDVAEQVKHETGDGVAFIHMEIYNDNDANKGTRPQVRNYKLPTEPWLFVIDKNGRISTAVEGAFSVPELAAAVKKVEAQP